MLLNGLVFELPVLIYALIWLGPVQRATLACYRRYAFLALTIVTALILPTTDLVTFLIATVPLYLLYELGLLMAWVAPRRRTSLAP